ncbi:hypothetical protein AW736_13120 [Termitidicoccus mucosus]|uniref:Uncharacterized protein n=1 Tax=Termitidicoccus mucosus TaxID=1184151 RepID=A0A178IHE3_9BACT|nr:hypothetical protein AW736_13120 [Opitutaceae bacterium TSB47]
MSICRTHLIEKEQCQPSPKSCIAFRALDIRFLKQIMEIFSCFQAVCEIMSIDMNISFDDFCQRIVFQQLPGR